MFNEMDNSCSHATQDVLPPPPSLSLSLSLGLHETQESGGRVGGREGVAEALMENVEDVTDKRVPACVRDRESK